MSQFGWNNCPQAAYAQVQVVIDSAVSVLGHDVIGVYLHGSLALGCFNPLRSDLDLLVVTQQRMAVETKRTLAELLLTTSGAPFPIEISFLTDEQLSPWRHPTPFDLHFSEDWRSRFASDLAGGEWRGWNDGEQRDPDLAGHITVTRQRGIALHGKPIANVFPAPPRADYLSSVLADVLSPAFGIAAVDAPPVYVILNACRTLAYLHTGQVMSKDEGGAWALGGLPSAHHPLIAAALVAYREDGDDARLAAFDAGEFADFVRNEIDS